ncbi:imelysin family protein [Gramella sp. GC03-9]|uniref:Imelysin family protein n=1 Tax=Christiangramia oceanisediminis TaxID=2920386 RepID=A0A9X2KZG6_9FLAO|nr:imelysin family protein [Gramella oceanisediminis]MCP9201215.1 imelysin family protein [Gramella oceanisediminis]
MKRISGLLMILLLSFNACSTDDSGEGSGEKETDSFDRGAMLTHWADNIIVPSFEAFQASSQSLENATEAYVNDPSAGTLSALKQQYRDSYLQFQTVSMFEIGKAEQLGYRRYLNTYPTNTSAIESKIESGSYNLELPSSFAEQGFPAMDYLLYGLGSSEETIQAFTAGENAETYRAYLLDVAKRINSLTAEVTTAWQGDFRDQFVENTSSSATGSVDRFSNDYVMYFEKFLRSGKIGYPAGAFTGSPSPENAEAVYAGDLSKELYIKAFEAFQDFYFGRNFNSSGNGPSYKQYLEYLDSMKDGADLSVLIEDRFQAIESQSEQLDDNFKSQVQNNNTTMLAAFDELQKAVVLLKVDMMQALSISVDYVDSDGD